MEWSNERIDNVRMEILKNDINNNLEGLREELQVGLTTRLNLDEDGPLNSSNVVGVVTDTLHVFSCWERDSRKQRVSPYPWGGGGDKIAEILLVRVRDIAVKSAYSPLFDRHYCSPSKILHHRFLQHHPSIVDLRSNLAANLIVSSLSADYTKETIEKRGGRGIFFRSLHLVRSAWTSMIKVQTR